MRGVLLAALSVLERGLDVISRAEARVELRRFLRDNPGVTIRDWTDGT